MSLWTLPLSFAAGVLTILSPCVLPLVPVVIAGARAQDPRAPLALAAGLAATFGVVGGLLASLGVDFGEAPFLRPFAAIIIVLVGLALLAPAVGHRLEAALAPLQRFGDVLQTRLPQSGLAGQAAAGALLALVWAPCAGPTLAAALALAARGGSLAFAMLSMGVFALGAAGALLALGYGVGRLAGAHRGAALATGAAARSALGAAFCLVGLAILTGVDHALESLAVAYMPDWLNRLAIAL
ncbi:cytochrome c biogenesis protein CcdA [Rhodoblastus sp.]|uniref:cytochrome c biogenesis protein CcdA n=1 Tax=Rhodoblastus sp. TaxID=1962975 RepID=UPI0035B40B39